LQQPTAATCNAKATKLTLLAGARKIAGANEKIAGVDKTQDIKRLGLKKAEHVKKVPTQSSMHQEQDAIPLISVQETAKNNNNHHLS